MRNRPKIGSFWTRTLNEARKSNDWMIIPRTYSMRTARQLASDLRNAHKRPESLDLAGVRPGEKWEAKWRAPYDESKRYNCTVSIRLVESSPV
jgi:hypothetical protein